MSQKFKRSLESLLTYTKAAEAYNCCSKSTVIGVCVYIIIDFVEDNDEWGDSFTCENTAQVNRAIEKAKEKGVTQLLVNIDVAETAVDDFYVDLDPEKK